MAIDVAQLVAPYIRAPRPEEITGTCWSDEFDVLFARGFPLIRFVAGEAQDLASTLADLDRQRYYTSLGLIWPEAVARHLVTQRLRLAPERLVAELVPALRLLLCGSAPNATRGQEEFALLLEGVFGTELVFGAVVDALDADEHACRGFHVWGWGVLVAFSAMAARAEPALREAAFARLRSLHQRAPTPLVRCFTDAIVNGDQGVERSGHKSGSGLNPWMGALLQRGSTRINSLIRRVGREGTFHARLAYLGDVDVVMPELAKKLSAITQPAEREFYAVSVCAIAHPKAVDLAIEAWDQSPSRDSLRSWFSLFGPRFARALRSSTDPRGKILADLL